MNNSHQDTFFNSSLIAVGIVGLLLAVIDGPAPDRVQTTASLVVSEARA